MKQFNLNMLRVVFAAAILVFNMASLVSCGKESDEPFSEYENKKNDDKSDSNNGDNNDNTNSGQSISGYYNGYAYVDMGLSVKWATYNIGAKKPYETGGYYEWGDISTKTRYDIENSKWLYWDWDNSYPTSIIVKKYCTNSNCGILDNKVTLEITDDVASRSWKGNWRMPIKKEMEELVEQCTWKWYSKGNEEYNGVAGYKVISKKNGNYLFLPAAGIYDLSEIKEVGEEGYYWTATLGDSDVECLTAYLLNFLSISDAYQTAGNAIRHVFDGNALRCNGLQVRAVCP